MSVFDETTIEWGQPGIPGTGLTAGEKTNITSRLTALEALPVPPDTTTDLNDWSTTAPTDGQFAIYNSSTGEWTPTTRPPITVTVAAEYFLDGGGAVITPGVKGHLFIPHAATLTGVYLIADQTGSIQMDIWIAPAGTSLPTNAHSVTGANEPRIVSAAFKADTTLSGWTTAVAANSTVRFNVDSATTITQCLIALVMTRSI